MFLLWVGGGPVIGHICLSSFQGCFIEGRAMFCYHRCSPPAFPVQQCRSHNFVAGSPQSPCNNGLTGLIKRAWGLFLSLRGQSLGIRWGWGGRDRIWRGVLCLGAPGRDSGPVGIHASSPVKQHDQKHVQPSVGIQDDPIR